MCCPWWGVICYFEWLTQRRCHWTNFWITKKTIMCDDPFNGPFYSFIVVTIDTRLKLIQWIQLIQSGFSDVYWLWWILFYISFPVGELIDIWPENRSENLWSIWMLCNYWLRDKLSLSFRLNPSKSCLQFKCIANNITVATIDVCQFDGAIHNCDFFS